ncbi:MAG: DUF3413 domain-containing protein [Gammaproteobacteria bacterium]|nr:DUF3413 domain-containing protein [Gammaproteobacteria bacterium]MCW8928004.1 DUF3413 domain-containing protein [Gammaproteobacteria bacterium]MCW8958648.1 DUF3413 domain-containing protein [Gammaproteobacteria bacterium]MCW8972698.1 DUF3413 domain-containing protein [Gammaproteobacteria bacterium]MCW8992337.1 DUF3413 domain-containing protein [Gammaproteobacteria bacterium]
MGLLRCRAQLSDGGRAAMLRWVSWYAFFVASVLLLIGIRYSLAAGVPEGSSEWTFLLAMSVGHWYSITFLFTFLLLYPLVLLYPGRRFITTIALALATVVLLAVFIDTFVFSLYRFHINGMVLSLLFSDAATEIFVFGPGMYLAVAAATLVTLLLAWKLACLAGRMSLRSGSKWLGPLLGLGLFAVFLGENYWFAWADAAGEVSITRQARLYPVYFPARARDHFYAHGIVEPSQAGQQVALVDGAIDYPKQPLNCVPAEPLPNIFLIVVDSWRYDDFGPEVTPNIHAFSREAIYFSHHYSGGNNTRTGIFSLFYGLPATYWESFLDEQVGALWIEQLLANDYDLAIYASAKLTAPEFNRTVFSKVPGLRTQTRAGGVYERDVKATDEFIGHLSQVGERPLFGFLFYDAPHAYAYDKEFDDLFQPAAEKMSYLTLTDDTDPTPYHNLFRKAVRSADKQVGRALQAIRDSGSWDESIIIVTSDHGQEFNDNGNWGHNANYTDVQIRVPLLIKWPGREAVTVDYTSSHYDISTTLLQQVFGCRNPASDYSTGASLFSDENRYGLVVGGFGKFGVRMADRIYAVDHFGAVELRTLRAKSLEGKPDPQVMLNAMEQTSRFYK